MGFLLLTACSLRSTPDNHDSAPTRWRAPIAQRKIIDKRLLRASLPLSFLVLVLFSVSALFLQFILTAGCASELFQIGRQVSVLEGKEEEAGFNIFSLDPIIDCLHSSQTHPSKSQLMSCLC